MNKPLNIESDKPLCMRETSNGFFEMLLPVCDASILSKILDPDVPYVTLLGFPSGKTADWIEQNIPPLFDPVRRIECVRVQRLDMDVTLATADFLSVLSSLLGSGLELIQGFRPIPRTLAFADLNPESRGRVFSQVGIEIQFYLPHAQEHAVVGSPSAEVLKGIVAKLAT